MGYNLSFWFNLYNFNLHSSGRIFAVSNEGIQCSLDLGHDCSFDYKRSRPKIDKKLQEVPLPAWNLLLFGRQEFLDNHLAKNPIPCSQQSKEHLKWEKKSFPVIESRLWMPASMSYQTWLTLNISGKTRSSRWMLSWDLERYSLFFTNRHQQLGDGRERIIRKTPLYWMRTTSKRTPPPPPKTPMPERPIEPPRLVARKLSFWETDWKCARLSL